MQNGISDAKLGQIMQVLQRYFQAPDQSYFLFGPRGSGKSTLMKLLYPKALCIPCDKFLPQVVPNKPWWPTDF